MKLETLEIGKYRIELPIGLDTPLDTPVRDSYQEFLKTSFNDVRRHLTCLTTLLPPEIAHVERPLVLHAFGGVGASAQVINQSVKDARHVFYERDPVCVQYLANTYPNDLVVPVTDSFEMLASKPLHDYQIILLDMSVGTIKTKGVKPMWANVAKTLTIHPNSVVWFTDTACHKIHLNYKTYTADFDGRECDKTAESYLHNYSDWLEHTHNLTITAAMREAGEYYCVVKHAQYNQRFQSIPYV